MNFNVSFLSALLMFLISNSMLFGTSMRSRTEETKKSDSIIVVLTGPSGSGKSTLAKPLKQALEKASSQSWQVVALDDLDDSVIEEYNETSTITAENLALLDQIAQTTKSSNVIVDTVLQDNKEAAAFKKKLLKKFNNVFLVVVYCDPETLIARTIKRKDRSPVETIMQYPMMFSPSPSPTSPTPKSSPSPTSKTKDGQSKSPTLTISISSSSGLDVAGNGSVPCDLETDQKGPVKFTDVPQLFMAPNSKSLDKLTLSSIKILCESVIPKSSRKYQQEVDRLVRSLSPSNLGQDQEFIIISAITAGDIIVYNRSEKERDEAIAQIIALIDNRLFQIPCKQVLDEIIQKIEKQKS